MHDRLTQRPFTSAGRVSDPRLFLLVLLVVFPVYWLTADRTIPYHIDPFTNAITAYTIAQTGSPILDDYAALAQPGAYSVLGWVVESPRGPVSQYPPGASWLAAPAYLLASGGGETMSIAGVNDPGVAPVEIVVPPLWPAALTASLSAAIAVALTALTVRRVSGSLRLAAAAALVLAAGTGLWLNGAYQLWQHGPSTMWIALGLYLTSRQAWFPSGLALGLALLTRPPVAIVSAGIGVWSGIRERSLRPVLAHGAGAAVGLVLLLVYNHWLFDTITVSGGYGSGFTDNLTETGLGWYVGNVLGGIFSLDRGLFVWSPIVAVAAAGIIGLRREMPGWAVGAVVGSVVLLAVQFRLNRYSGGDGFFSYRYPLEAVVAAAPALAVGARSLWERRPGRIVVLVAAMASVLFHLIGLVRELAG